MEGDYTPSGSSSDDTPSGSSSDDTPSGSSSDDTLQSGSSKLITEATNACSNQCYQFTIYDSYGDGLVSPGYYKIFYDEELFQQGPGSSSFFEESSGLMGGGCPSNEPSPNKPSSSPNPSNEPSSSPKPSTLSSAPSATTDYWSPVSIDILTDNTSEENKWVTSVQFSPD